jgi:hypothetical protein
MMSLLEVDARCSWIGWNVSIGQSPIKAFKEAATNKSSYLSYIQDQPCNGF